jgi:hypothetical protein
LLLGFSRAHQAAPTASRSGSHRVVGYPCTTNNSPLRFGSSGSVNTPEGSLMGSAGQWLGCEVPMPPDLRTPPGVNAFGRSALRPVVTPVSQLRSAYRPPPTAGARGARRRRWHPITTHLRRPYSRRTVCIHSGFSYQRRTATWSTAYAFDDGIAAPVTKWRCTMPIRPSR